MSIPRQRIFAGRLEEAYRGELAALTERRAVEKLWQREPNLWKAEPEHARVILNRLGWLDSIEPMRGEVPALETFAGETRAAGFRDAVLLGMGGSSLAPEVFSLVFPRPAEAGRLFVLDSTVPPSVLAAERAVDLRRTLFLVASKSGSTIETVSQLRYFYERVAAAGVTSPGANFVAITDAGSSLDTLACEKQFRTIFRNAADIGGRYSALSYFGLVPAALYGVPLAAVLDAAAEMHAACGPAAAVEENPGLTLGALLGAGARVGAGTLALLASPALASLGSWIEQLVAESTGKEGKGILPVAGEAPGPAELFTDSVVAVLSLLGEESPELENFAASLRRQGISVVEMVLEAREQLGAEFFKWEVATAMASAALGVNPFDEPNVTESKNNTARLLKEAGPRGARRPTLTEDGIEVQEGGVGAGSLADALEQLLQAPAANDYLAVLAFVDRNAENSRRLDALRLRLRDIARLPVTLGFGPRYLHSIGQFYKGGPAAGRFLLLTASDEEDLAIPDAPYTFGQLQQAQALGDLQSLVSRGKPVAHLHFRRGATEGLERLEKLVASLRREGPNGRPFPRVQNR